MTHSTTHTVMDNTPAISSYTASGSTAVYGLLTVQEWVAVIGLFLGVATFAVNWYYRREHLKLAKEAVSHEQEPADD